MTLKALKYFLFLILLAAFWCPLLMNYYPLISEKKLVGYFEIPDSAFILSDTSWLSGNFQEKFEKRYNYSMGMHRTGIRLNNQLNFWMGEQSSTIVVGKENNLMDPAYIASYLGKDFLGKDSIERECERIQQLQSLLKQNGIEFFIVIAPNKSRIYKEHIPDFYHPEKRIPGNYEHYIEGFKKHDINHINVQEWFEQAKDTSRYPLFTNLGVHWSVYGGLLFTDSLLNYIEKKTNRKLNKIKLKSITELDTAQATDDDLYKLMNLIFPIKQKKKFAYMDREFPLDSANQRPQLLAVGDSYWFTVANFGVPRLFFGDSTSYFYYNSTAYFDHNIANRPVSEVDFDKIVMKNNIILLIYSEPNLKLSWNGFVEKTLAELRKRQNKQ